MLSNPELASQSYQEHGIWYTPERVRYQDQQFAAEDAENRAFTDELVFGKYASVRTGQRLLTQEEAVRFLGGEAMFFIDSPRHKGERE